MSWEVVWLMVISIVAARLGDFLLFGVGKVLVWDFGMLLLPVLSFVLAAIVSVMLAALRPHSFPPPFLPPGVIRAFALALLIIPYWSGIRPLVEEPRFWMPHERLKFTAEAPFTGYVLNSNDDYLVILNDDPRIIIEKPKAELEERDYCYLYPGSMHYEKDFAKTGRTVPVCP